MLTLIKKRDITSIHDEIGSDKHNLAIEDEPTLVEEVKPPSVANDNVLAVGHRVDGHEAVGHVTSQVAAPITTYK